MDCKIERLVRVLALVALFVALAGCAKSHSPFEDAAISPRLDASRDGGRNDGDAAFGPDASGPPRGDLGTINALACASSNLDPIAVEMTAASTGAPDFAAACTTVVGWADCDVDVDAELLEADDTGKFAPLAVLRLTLSATTSETIRCQYVDALGESLACAFDGLATMSAPECGHAGGATIEGSLRVEGDAPFEVELSILSCDTAICLL